MSIKYFDNTDVLTGSGLGSGITSSSLTSVGTLNGLTVQSSAGGADIILIPEIKYSIEGIKKK